MPAEPAPATITAPDGAGPPRTKKRGVAGWMFFDWAAQPFFTVVTTFIFGPYVVSRMAEDPTMGQAAWGYGIAFAGIVIAVLSPFLGAIADNMGPRKPWIAAFAAVKIVCLLLLWNSAPGSSLTLVIGLFALATIAAEFSTVFNDSMLPSLVSKRRIGMVSNIAWGLGYLGGMIVLILVIALLAASPDTGKTILGLDPLFGLDPAQGEGDRATAPFAALWYLVFVLPMFLLTPDQRLGHDAKTALRVGLQDIKRTFADMRTRPGLFRFLMARMIYHDGVNALIALGGTFAASLFLWQTTEIGIYGIILNVAAIIGCTIAAFLDTRFGSKAVVIWSLVFLSIATVGISSTSISSTLFGLMEFSTEDTGGLFATGSEKAFIVYGLLIGFAFGPVQASSRAYFARSIAAHEAGRFFGLYALVGRATSFVAPFMVATVTLWTGSTRAGMATILIFFFVGLAILITTPYPADNPEEKPAQQ